ncbi:hypothetical protein V7S43_016606 [Phytophthora oleae]|uniref:Uncharacterized protein n=1 Tax=Phytophthora oleae TaxID=2107226 RepID=A0ABD3EZV2_9STRA
MSTALWYYCSVLDEASNVVPVVQRLQNAVQDNLKAPAVRPASELTVGVEGDDELAVGRSTYVLAAAFTATPVEEVEIQKDLVIVAEPVKGELKTEVAAVEVVTVKSVVEKVGEEAIDEAASTQEPFEEEGKEVVAEEKVEGSAVVQEEAVAVEAKVEETASDVAVVETVNDAVEIVAVVEEEILDSVVAQAAVEEKSVEKEAEQPVSEPAVLEEPVAKDTTKDAEGAEAPAVEDDIPIVDKAEDVILDIDPEPRKLVTRMPSIPEDTESVHGVDDELPASENEDVVEEEPAPEKLIADDESETETQSEISEAPAIEAVESVPIAKVEGEPESEIEETMVIDPALAAKEAAAVRKQTSAFSFIPEQIRNNSYAVSSVAVAVTTAIVATLVARR